MLIFTQKLQKGCHLDILVDMMHVCDIIVLIKLLSYCEIFLHTDVTDKNKPSDEHALQSDVHTHTHTHCDLRVFKMTLSVSACILVCLSPPREDND